MNPLDYPIEAESEYLYNKKIDELKAVADMGRELARLIAKQEVTDDGRVFCPNKVHSCRVMDGTRIGELVEALIAE